jgi:hypothetical protein
MTTASGATSDRLFRSKLASYTLAQGNHEIVLINASDDSDPTYLDLDYITITTGDGNAQ